jgi:hypothetical protein
LDTSARKGILCHDEIFIADFVLHIVDGMCDRHASFHASSCPAHLNLLRADSDTNY